MLWYAGACWDHACIIRYRCSWMFTSVHGWRRLQHGLRISGSNYRVMTRQRCFTVASKSTACLSIISSSKQPIAWFALTCGVLALAKIIESWWCRTPDVLPRSAAIPHFDPCLHAKSHWGPSAATFPSAAGPSNCTAGLPAAWHCLKKYATDNDTLREREREGDKATIVSAPNGICRTPF